MKIQAAPLLLALLLAGCPKPLPGPVPPGPADAGAPADGPATCERLCSDGRALGCDWAQPTPTGAPCEDVCRNATVGGPVAWDLACRVAGLEGARGCLSVDLCP